MNPRVSKIAVPPASAIVRELPGAYFYDCYAVSLLSAGGSALEIYLKAVGNTPRWVNVLMALRNWAVALVGLKNLGQLAALTPDKPASSYRVGDRVGIFSLRMLSENEIILGDNDRHLNVQVSVCKLGQAQPQSVAVATVVHVHNRLGRLYMLFVAPLHRRIAPAILANIG
jgi:hypothetical protein